MLTIVDANDQRAIRNKDKVLAFYDMMLNQQKPEEACAKYLDPGYIQHNPGIPTGAAALGKFFAEVVKGRPKLHVKAHRVIASGDYVWVHVNFLNLYSDDDADLGVAGVDIFRMDAEGRVVEHWDALQAVPDPRTSANTNGMF
jgi:predicted SnoaL-like aldol condensation-catalyzing enzyme